MEAESYKWSQRSFVDRPTLSDRRRIGRSKIRSCRGETGQVFVQCLEVLAQCWKTYFDSRFWPCRLRLSLKNGHWWCQGLPIPLRHASLRTASSSSGEIDLGQRLRKDGTVRRKGFPLSNNLIWGRWRSNLAATRAKAWRVFPVVAMLSSVG